VVLFGIGRRPVAMRRLEVVEGDVQEAADKFD
jgi:hypothetical protein